MDDFLKKFLDLLSDAYQNKMPFNKFLGVKIISLSLEEAVLRIDMRPELIGNYEQKILHGGVISSIIDLAGGIMAQVDAINHMKGLSLEEIVKRYKSMSTIDMRIDYLKPGKGEYFIIKSKILHSGKKVSKATTEFISDDGVIIAVGTGAYLVG